MTKVLDYVWDIGRWPWAILWLLIACVPVLVHYLAYAVEWTFGRVQRGAYWVAYVCMRIGGY